MPTRRCKPSTFALVVLLTLIPATVSSAQKAFNRRPKETMKQVAGGSATRFQLTSELKQQQKFLGDVAARYEAVSVYDFIPLFSYTYVWNALRENRLRLVDPRRMLKPDQVRLIKESYELLETGVVLRFLDHQLCLLDETLQLDELQYAQIEKILSADLMQKRSLLSTHGINSKRFLQRVQAVSHQSENNILAVLSDEQRKNFHKQVGLMRYRLRA